MTMVLTAPTLVGGAARTIAERALRPEHVSGLRKRRHEARQLVLAFRRWRNGCRRRQRPRPHRTTTTLQKWICESCGFIYDPEEGDPDGGIPPGTAFEDIPDTWFCPVCGARKRDFTLYED